MKPNFRSRPRSRVLALLLCAGALAAPPLLAAEGSQGSPGSASRSATAPAAQGALARDARASQIIGRDVRDPSGAKLGRIEDLIVNLGSGRLQYAVLSFGGVLGVGDKLFAYPVNAFRTSADNDDLVLTVDRNQLNAAPGFDKARWPGLDTDSYWRDVERYHGAGQRAAAGAASTRLMRMSQLIDKDVNDRQGADAGEIEDVVVNMAQQRVHYVVLDFDKKWSPDDKMLALPLSALSAPAKADGDLVLNVPREQLDMKRGFDEDRWPDLNDPTYRRDVGGWLDHFPPTSRAQEQGR
ncbi:PRC-barrel domain-containing protein [Azohydromonas caseinilytica]|uniref:PRC-barrel domain containing protein n=1 Tax=Azohydromonas caseinilytica TaxID=2728836 RepID=A0A848F9M5_9BURK|nr:PRC-barrel domain-containing protein [Azohydromonas caseinilytica]NML15536.1 PRC-barrel domain containing protein [Azohydromonas caseinilytica]